MNPVRNNPSGTVGPLPPDYRPAAGSVDVLPPSLVEDLRRRFRRVDTVLSTNDPLLAGHLGRMAASVREGRSLAPDLDALFAIARLLRGGSSGSSGRSG
ncbi:MAG: hypothetical protein IRY95_09745 [Clostridia bacterium]|nr:hypothetical protein [Clostridia bacterium]